MEKEESLHQMEVSSINSEIEPTSDDEARKSTLDVKKKKRKRRRSSLKVKSMKRGATQKITSPDAYLNFIMERDRKLENAGNEIAKLKIEMDQLKQLGDADKSMNMHEVAEDLMVSVEGQPLL